MKIVYHYELYTPFMETIHLQCVYATAMLMDNEWIEVGRTHFLAFIIWQKVRVKCYPWKGIQFLTSFFTDQQYEINASLLQIKIEFLKISTS